MHLAAGNIERERARIHFVLQKVSFESLFLYCAIKGCNAFLQTRPTCLHDGVIPSGTIQVSEPLLTFYAFEILRTFADLFPSYVRRLVAFVVNCNCLCPSLYIHLMSVEFMSLQCKLLFRINASPQPECGMGPFSPLDAATSYRCLAFYLCLFCFYCFGAGNAHLRFSLSRHIAAGGHLLQGSFRRSNTPSIIVELSDYQLR
ncbi:hypothetical protein BJ912DRAFT_163555 [Pholiota molesta]|nr:hypothetical protein BJ912DRAFT_163555 [Pholiota molesta]